jgi:UrcA family protein
LTTKTYGSTPAGLDLTIVDSPLLIQGCPNPRPGTRYQGIERLTRIFEGIHVNTKTAVVSSWSVLGAAAVVCTLSAADVTAAGREVFVAIHVNTQGLDINQPAGAEKFYARLKHAAQVACTHGNRVGLESSPDPAGCHEKALGDAIRSVNVPLLTLLYLKTHTLRQAATHGINVTAQIAAKR